jgi:hypothetical protein
VTKPIEKKGIKNYIVYTVLGKDITNTDIKRRFSEFYTLREKFREKWPGIYIPGIPPKKVINNTDQKIIQKRVKILNSFLFRICNIPYFYNSEEIKIFISGLTDVSKDLNKIKKPKEEEIVQIYKDTFIDYYEAYDLIIGKGKIMEFKNYLKSFQNYIKVKLFLYNIILNYLYRISNQIYLNL